jgi:hypothetical protein
MQITCHTLELPSTFDHLMIFQQLTFDNGECAYVSGVWENVLANVEMKHAIGLEEALQKGCLENNRNPATVTCTAFQERPPNLPQCLS